MKSKIYNENFKEDSVAKLLASNSHGLSATARKIGVAPSTLYGWKKKYAMANIIMSKNKLKEWSSEKQLEIIIKTSSMAEQELGNYLRANGLHSSDLDKFKLDISNSLKRERGRPKIDPEIVELRKEKKKLERYLKNTQAALAEQSARIILLKKSHEIWGTKEDDE